MTIREIEQRTGLSRANIRFYELEGLISPVRCQNGYREYNEQDLQMLMRIKLLRSLGMSIEGIRSLKSGALTLETALCDRLRSLEMESYFNEAAQDVCRSIQKDSVSFDSLDAEKYLAELDNHGRSASMPSSYEQDAIPAPGRPWRRYFARMADLAVYGLLWSAFTAAVFSRNVSKTSSGLMQLADIAAGFILMLILEPIFLHFFGTTPGKAALGLYVESADGNRPGYWEALERTWIVFAKGFGYSLPIYNLVRLVKSYQAASRGEPLPWQEDERPQCAYRGDKWFRVPVYLLEQLMIIFLTVVLMLSQRIAPNRGQLTISEYAENYRYYSQYLDLHFDGWELGQDGQWIEQPTRQPGVGYMQVGFSEHPVYNYATDENGNLTSVSFHVQTNNADTWISLSKYHAHQILCALSFAGAQPQVGLFSKVPADISGMIYNQPLSDYVYESGGVQIECNTDWAGYEYIESAGVLLPQEDVNAYYFELEYKVSVVPESQPHSPILLKASPCFAGRGQICTPARLSVDNDMFACYYGIGK